MMLFFLRTYYVLRIVHSALPRPPTESAKGGTSILIYEGIREVSGLLEVIQLESGGSRI